MLGPGDFKTVNLISYSDLKISLKLNYFPSILLPIPFVSIMFASFIKKIKA